MPHFHFDLLAGTDIVQDKTGTELSDEWAATAHGHEVARELMRNNERKARHWCLLVRGEADNVLFEIPFAAVDPTIDHLSPEARALVEKGCEQRRALQEAVREVRGTVRRTRSIIARSRGRPYLVAHDGERLA
jgi:hypothetical protein